MTDIDGGALIPYTGADAASTREAIVSARVQLARQRAEIERAQAEQKAELSRKRAEIDRQRQEMEAQFEKARADLAAQMKPLQEQLAKMTEVMWTVDLYLGRDETLELIRDGAPAPDDAPITVRQKVLVMAEESIILMGKGATGMDSEKIAEFIDWLCADDANLDRVLPERKGVVVLIPTRVESRTRNAWEDAARNAENGKSFWLLRNGEKLYLLQVDEQLIVRDRVLPRRREFVEVFDQKLFGMHQGQPIRPGSDRWFELEKIADARRRHYMRILMVLQGLVDRTPVWHPLPAGGASFLSMKDRDAGRVVVIEDDEDSIQLGEGGESFADWQRRLNALLRPGLRVIGDWRSRGFSELEERPERSRWYHPRMYPETTSERPEPNVPHLLEGRKDGGFVLRFQRTEKVYKRNQPVPGRPGYVYAGETLADAKTRASCVVKPADTWVLPFDLITVPELERFLASRDERSKHFLSMVPTVRAALEAKQAEASEEAPFRGLLGQLLVTEGADAADVDALVDDLVHWWKLAHTWTKPLNGDPAHEKKAADQIVTEFRARQAATAEAASGAAERVLDAGTRVEGVICVGRDRQGRWWAYSPSPGAHDPGVFLDVTRIYRDGRLGETKTWQTVATRTAAALNVAWQDDDGVWSKWHFGANPAHFLTESQRAEIVEEAKALAGGLPLCVIERWNPKNPGRREIGAFAWVADERPARTNPTTVASPLGWRNDGVYVKGVARLVEPGPTPTISDTRASHNMPTTFDHFSSGTRWGNTPWWPDDATRYTDVRPRLLWADEAMLDEMKGWLDHCSAEAKAESDIRRARSAEADRYVRAAAGIARDRQTAAIRARFEEDYGTNADDLWEGHLSSLTIPATISGRDAQWVVELAIREGRPVVGETLDALAAAAMESGLNPPDTWGRRREVSFGEYGDIIVPEPAVAGTDD